MRLLIWWNKTIGNVTGSKMVRRVLAVGGVATDYFDRCWTEYLEDDETFDIALWEFNINDASFTNGTSVERFTRSVFSKFNRLDLLFTIFYTKNLLAAKRHSLNEEIVKDNAKYYNITCINIEPMTNHSTEKLELQHMYTKDHPSILAHAHMALSLISYYTRVLLRLLDSLVDEDTTDKIDLNLTLPSPKFVTNDHYDTTCWTAVTFDFNNHNLKHSLFALSANASKGFQQVLDGWKDVPEIRSDMTGGYKTSKANEHLYLTFNVTRNENQQSREVSLAFRGKPSTLTSIEMIKHVVVKAKYNITSRSSGLQVIPLGVFSKGKWTLHVDSIRGGIHICAVIIC